MQMNKVVEPQQNQNKKTHGYTFNI